MTDPKLEQQARELLATACGERVEDMLYDRPGSVAKDQAIRAIVAAMLAAAPQPPAEAQPVAWMRRAARYRGVDGRQEGERIISESKVHDDDIPLYAHPSPSAPAGVEWAVIVEGLRLADQFFDGDDNHWQWDDGEAFPASKVRTAYQAALAQQPAAVDGAMVERLAQAVATELYGEPPPPGSNSLTRAMMLPGIKRALTAALAAQQGGES